MEKREASRFVGWKCKLIQPVWKTVWRFLKKKLGVNLPYNPAIPPLGIHTEKITILKDTCIPMLNAALFTIARTGKQPRCPLTDGLESCGTYIQWNITQ